MTAACFCKEMLYLDCRPAELSQAFYGKMCAGRGHSKADIQVALLFSEHQVGSDCWVSRGEGTPSFVQIFLLLFGKKGKGYCLQKGKRRDTNNEQVSVGWLYASSCFPFLFSK